MSLRARFEVSGNSGRLERMPKHVTIRMLRQDALELGLLFCVCGHPPNNHYDEHDGGCAHCECERYVEEPRRGKFVKYTAPRTLEKFVRLVIRELQGDDLYDEIMAMVDRHWRNISREYE